MIKKVDYDVILKMLYYIVPYSLSGIKQVGLSSSAGFVPHDQYHDCWWLGDARNQGISSHHGVDLFPRKYKSGLFPREYSVFFVAKYFYKQEVVKDMWIE